MKPKAVVFKVWNGDPPYGRSWSWECGICGCECDTPAATVQDAFESAHDHAMTHVWIAA